jgi:hypothetical protein
MCICIEYALGRAARRSFCTTCRGRYLLDKLNCEEARWDSVPKLGIHMRKAHWQ